jgi:hypothetical protein
MTALRTMALLGAAAALALGGPAGAASKSFGLTNYERIVLNADFAVEVVAESPLQAVASGPQTALDRVDIRSANGVLTINDRRYASHRDRSGGAGPVTVRINAARVRAITVIGAGSLSIDRLVGAKVEVDLRGPGSVAVGNITADRLALSMTGNGKMTLAGTVKAADAIVSGAGVLDADKLTTIDLVANGEGAADQRYRATRTARVTQRGVGRIVVAGKAKCTVTNPGIGAVVCNQP